MRAPSGRAGRAGGIGPIALVLLLAPLTLAVPPRASRAAFLPEERIPTDSPLYRDLERLATTYRVAPRFLSSRPLRRAEATTFLGELRAAHPDAERDPAYGRAVRHLDPAAPGATPPLIARTGPGGERIEVSPYVSLLYSDDPRSRPYVNRDYRAGAALAASLDSGSVMVLDYYGGTASQGGRGTPNFGTLNAAIEGVDFNSWIGDAYLVATLARVRVLFGHTWLRWGPGRTGTLALSDAAPALDMLHGEATVFRSIRGQWFVALLDPGPQTYLAGHRLEARIGERLTVGLSELARFDGTSQAWLYFMPVIPYNIWEKRPKTGRVSPDDSSGLALNKNNILQSVDVSWNFRPGARIWAELMIDDISFSSDYKPDMIGYQLGAEVRRAIGAGRRVGAAAEWSRVNNFVYSAWHGHDFEFEGFPTGFVMGPDVSCSFGEVTYEHNARWEFGVRAEYREKGEGALGEPWSKSLGKVNAAEHAGIVEKEIRITWSAAYTPARGLRVEAGLATSQIKNLDHVISPGWDADVPLMARASLAW